DVSLLLKHSIPSAWVINKLRNAFGQAWFDGCQSIVDERSRDKARFPLYAIEFWVEMAQVLDGKKAWEESERWFRVEVEKALKGRKKTSPAVLAQIEAVEKALTRLP